MEKRQTLHLEHEEADSKVHPAAADPDLQSHPESSGTKEVIVQQNKQKRRSDCRQQRKQQIDEAERLDTTSAEQQQQQQPVLIHGLSVERYRHIYNSVLQPSVLAALSSSKQADYVSQVLELKQRLWTELSRPQLVETVREDGRVEVKEIFDLT